MSGVLTGSGTTPKVKPARVVGWVLGYLVLALVVGAISGVAWWRLVDLPGYMVGPDGGASTSERGLTEFISGDAWFSLIGIVVGIGLGVIAWRWFQKLGWPLALLAVLAAVGAALVCWYVGYRFGPGDFEPRLAAAKPGDFVPIELTVRAKASLVVWPLFATIPILLRSSLGQDVEEPRPILKKRPRR